MRIETKDVCAVTTLQLSHLREDIGLETKMLNICLTNMVD